MENKKTVYYKDKAAYNQALLEALKDCRKKRVDDPGQAFANAVIAFESILLPEEREEINDYKLDPLDYEEEKKQAKKLTGATNDTRLIVEILLNEYKKISWPVYRGLCEELHNKSLFPDVSGDGQVDRIDVKISIYEALLEKIIEVLKSHGWLTFEIGGEMSGGGGHGLNDDEDDLN